MCSRDASFWAEENQKSTIETFTLANGLSVAVLHADNTPGDAVAQA